MTFILDKETDATISNAKNFGASWYCFKNSSSFLLTKVPSDLVAASF